MFSCEFSEISKNTVFTKHLRRAVHRTPEVFYEKGIIENLATITEKHLWFAKFPRTPFLQNTSATATLLKWGTANIGWKTLDECSLSRNTNLKSTVQIYHFFLGSINSQCMFLLVYTVYCQKQPSEPRCLVKKVFLKIS